MAFGKAWTEEENEILEKMYGSYSFNQIAKKVNRTPIAVKGKAKRLGLGGPSQSTEYISLEQLKNALGVEGTVVKNWAEKHGLKMFRKVIAFKGKYYRLKIQDFWSWAESNKDKVKWHKLDVNILGKEPKWVKEARKLELKKPRKRQELWTKTEDSYLKMYWKGKTAKEIGIILDRPEDGVTNRAYKLGLPKKVIPLPWTAKEVRKLKKMKKEGYSDSEVAEELGRTTPSVIGKRRSLSRKKKVAPACKHKEQPISKNSITL